MEQYIPKSSLVAEIEKRIEHNTEWKDTCKTLAVLAANQAIEEDKKILSIIDTLEAKEVDLEKESISWENIPQLISIAERFRTDVFISTKRITREDFYKEVLKRFKNMKGE